MSRSATSRLRHSPLLWLSPLGLLLVAAAFAAAPRCALAADTPVVIEGEAEVIVEDYEDYAVTRYFVRDNGRRVELKFAGRPADLVTGQTVRVRGRIKDPGAGAALETLAVDGESGIQSTGTPPLANTLGEQKTLVMLVNFQDNSSAPISLSSAQSLVFNSTGDYMRENSAQQTWLSGTTVGWYTLSLSAATCDYNAIANAADQAATASGISLSTYRRKIYMFPSLSSCGWAGLGTVGGNPSRSWINGSFSLRTVAHELGHNYGLRHAYAKDCGTSSIGDNCTVVTYGDPVDVMGAASSAHFGSFNKERLGWLGAGQSPTIATATASGRYYIDGYVSSGFGDKALRVQRGTDASTGKPLWYYLEYRRPVGFDGSLGSSGNLVSGVVVREAREGDTNSNYFLDMTPNSSTNSSTDMRDGALVPGASFTDAAAGVTLSVAWVDGATAAIDVVVPGGGTPTPTCTRAAPTLTLSGGSSSVEAGQGTSYTVSLSNRDSSACTSASFSLSRSVPTGWGSTLGASTLSVSPGATVSTTLAVTSDTTASAGSYPISVGASRSTGDGASASTTLSVTQPLPSRKVRVSSISFSTSKKGPNYKTTATATLVDEGGKAVASASVTGCFSGADGSCATGTSTASGKASFTSGNYRSGSVGFCVTAVSGSGLEFDSTGSCKTP